MSNIALRWLRNLAMGRAGESRGLTKERPAVKPVKATEEEGERFCKLHLIPSNQPKRKKKKANRISRKSPLCAASTLPHLHTRTSSTPHPAQLDGRECQRFFRLPTRGSEFLWSTPTNPARLRPRQNNPVEVPLEASSSSSSNSSSREKTNAQEKLKCQPGSQ